VAPHDVMSELKNGVRGLRLAMGEGVCFENLDPQVEAAVRAGGDVLRDLGAEVTAMPIPEFDRLSAIPERFAALNREAYSANRPFFEAQQVDLDPAVMWIAKGKDIDESESRDVLERLADLKARLLETLREVDAVLVPTTPIPAKPVNEVDAEHGSFAGRYGRNTMPGNLLGLSAVSLPCGFTEDGLPIGLMIMAKPFREETALRVAQAYEQATPWHRRHPDLGWIG